MASTLYGNDGLVLSHAGELTADKNGLWTGACVFKMPAGRVDLIPAIGSVHPYANFCVAERFRLSFSAGLWVCSVEYVGGNVGESEPQYELSPGTGQEDIETHPDFVSVLAGKPSAPLHGAVFLDKFDNVSTDDTLGIAMFDRFSSHLEGGSLNPYAKIDAYLCQNNTVWTKTWTRNSPPPSTGIRIATPDGPNPDYGGASNWLAMPVAYTKRGNVYSCTARWLASGPRAWNPNIYPS